MSSSNFHDFIVPGLDVLISDPSFLTPDKDTKPKAKTLYIPSFYVYRVADFYNEQSNRGESARELTTTFGVISSMMDRNGSDFITYKNGMRLEFIDFPENSTFRGMTWGQKDKENSSKFHAIAAAKKLQDKYGKENVAIMTGSEQLATPAAFNRIDVARVNPDVYTGRVKVLFPAEYASLWWRDYSIPKRVWGELFPDTPLTVNQYVELIFDDYGQVDASYQSIGRFDGEAVVPLRFTKMNNPAFRHIRPKTPGQAMLFDALLAPLDELPIVIASGTFGTGKTFSAVAAGLAQTMDEEYRKIFVCPRDGALGREIGFLKGDKLDKILPQAAPILDNPEAVISMMDIKQDGAEFGGNGKRKKGYGQSNRSLKALVEKYRNEYFEFEPVIFMTGRSIQDAFIIYDEFQDMERGQMRALLTRSGNDSKIVVMGDPNQVTNPHLNRTSNGLSYAASKMAGDPLTAIVSFDESSEIVRSPAARHIAERLSSNKFVNVV